MKGHPLQKGLMHEARTTASNEQKINGPAKEKTGWDKSGGGLPFSRREQFQGRGGGRTPRQFLRQLVFERNIEKRECCGKLEDSISVPRGTRITNKAFRKGRHNCLQGGKTLENWNTLQEGAGVTWGGGGGTTILRCETGGPI